MKHNPEYLEDKIADLDLDTEDLWTLIEILKQRLINNHEGTMTVFGKQPTESDCNCTDCDCKIYEFDNGENPLIEICDKHELVGLELGVVKPKIENPD